MGSCRRNFGLGEPVVLHAMHQMKAAGTTHAIVANTGTNETSRELYKACGFEPWHLTDDYLKPIPAAARPDGLDAQAGPFLSGAGRI